MSHIINVDGTYPQDWVTERTTRVQLTHEEFEALLDTKIGARDPEDIFLNKGYLVMNRNMKFVKALYKHDNYRYLLLVPVSEWKGATHVGTIPWIEAAY